MAYFAQIDENNVVLQVIAVSNADAPDPAPNDQAGQQFLASLGLGTNWIQTSYNHNFRKQYAGPGYTYSHEHDVFIGPQPFPSWSLDEQFDWQPPIPYPSDGRYTWDETNQEWVPVD
jgi:hypothetical protein